MVIDNEGAEDRRQVNAHATSTASNRKPWIGNTITQKQKPPLVRKYSLLSYIGRGRVVRIREDDKRNTRSGSAPLGFGVCNHVRATRIGLA